VRSFDHKNIEQGTDFMIGQGVYFLHAHRFAQDELSHAFRLFRWAELDPGMKVLDVGSGIGSTAAAWKQFMPSLHFSCLNINKYQLDMTPEWCERILGDMQDMPIKDDSFDMAICFFSMGHADRGAQTVIGEMARVVKPGGIVFIYDMTPDDDNFSKLHDMSYMLYPRKFVESCAKSFGLELDVYLEPIDRGTIAEKVPAVTEVFAGLRPAVWRFVRSMSS
jgi:ubiquinone/menaquinone biosynthesis C-methylase UbiE